MYAYYSALCLILLFLTLSVTANESWHNDHPHHSHRPTTSRPSTACPCHSTSVPPACSTSHSVSPSSASSSATPSSSISPSLSSSYSESTSHIHVSSAYPSPSPPAPGGNGWSASFAGCYDVQVLEGLPEPFIADNQTACERGFHDNSVYYLYWQAATHRCFYGGTNPSPNASAVLPALDAFGTCDDGDVTVLYGDYASFTIFRGCYASLPTSDNGEIHDASNPNPTYCHLACL
nr:uncharacterized protein CI109_003309 [Kwoniella shandongensis]KAA5528409.1 hypothetical protein CI109_003309 [Kwoniella shandongensis]